MDLGHWTTKLTIEEGNLPYGFIYVITNTVNGKQYIGKKQMKSVKKLKIIIEYLEKVEKLTGSLTFDCKNVIDLQKLETT